MLVFLAVEELLVPSPTTTVTIGDPSATLSCELYGYLTSQPPTITWNFGSDVLMNDSVFTITVQDGSHMIQNGGNTTQPSMRSVLTINRPNTTYAGSISVQRVEFWGLSHLKWSKEVGSSIVLLSMVAVKASFVYEHRTEYIPYNVNV